MRSNTWNIWRIKGKYLQNIINYMACLIHKLIRIRALKYAEQNEILNQHKVSFDWHFLSEVVTVH